MVQSVPAGPPLPLLVLGSGAPASGKSTLAPILARQLALPLLARDTISEALSEVFHPRENRQTLLAATFRVFYRLMADMLRTGEGLVAESNFHRDAAEHDLRPFLTRAHMVVVHCHTPQAVSFQRFAARFAQEERRRSSFDAARIWAMRAGRVPEAWERAQPLDLPVPILTVDTTDGYAPALDAIVAFIHAASAES